MGGLHHLDHLLRENSRVFLLHELRKDAFEIGKMHELLQIGGASVGQHAALGNYHDTAANLLNHFKNVGDIEHGFALGSE